MEILFYIFYFAMLFSVYKFDIIEKLKEFFKNPKVLITLEMFGKVLWGIGVSISGAFISEKLAFSVLKSFGFWLGFIFIVIGVFLDVKALKAREIMEKKEK